MPPQGAAASSLKGKTKAGGKGAQLSPEATLKTLTDDFHQRTADLEKAKVAAEEGRNYAQLERDKIIDFWDITKTELKDCQAELRNKDRVAEELEERHQVEIKVYKQKVKHLLYEHQNNIAALRIEGEEAVKAATDACQAQIQALHEDKEQLEQRLREQAAQGLEALGRARLDAAKEASKIRSDAAAAARDLAATYDTKLAVAQEEADLRRRTEIQAVEERKNAHIQGLMEDHKKAFKEMRAYYNDITANTLDLIKALKGDAAELKRREAAAQALALEVAQENSRLVEPLEAAKKEAAELRNRLNSQNSTAASLDSCRTRLLASEKRIKTLEWQNEVLEQQKEVLGKTLQAMPLDLRFSQTLTGTRLFLGTA